MRHLKPEDVEYSTRPRTVFEESIWIQLESLSSKHPQYHQMWSIFLWSRQDEVLDQGLFTDILVTDFVDHQEKCLGAMNRDNELRKLFQRLNDNWHYQFGPRDYDSPEKRNRQLCD